MQKDGNMTQKEKIQSAIKDKSPTQKKKIYASEIERLRDINIENLSTEELIQHADELKLYLRQET